MTQLMLEIGHSQLNKSGEELCGDSIEVAHARRSTIVILSDGLGSGVKANILSSLTTKIGSTMLRQGGSIDEVIETLASTLPVCRVRKLAYSTFTILQIFRDGRAYLAEYDNPSTYFGHQGKLKRLNLGQRKIGERTIREGYFRVQEGDWLVMVSDGILHAGIGGVWDLGWGWERVGSYLEKLSLQQLSAKEMAAEISNLCYKLYGGAPGDDASVVVVKLRQLRRATILVGPPKDPRHDRLVIEKLLKDKGQKIVCGGTTGNMVGKYLGCEVKVDLSACDDEVPPIGILPGIDLVTEGMLTLIKVRENLKNNVSTTQMLHRNDGASRLTLLLLEMDSIRFLVGCAINPAHQAPVSPEIPSLKQHLIQEIIKLLRRRGKKVVASYF